MNRKWFVNNSNTVTTSDVVKDLRFEDKDLWSEYKDLEVQGQKFTAKNAYLLIYTSK